MTHQTWLELTLTAHSDAEAEQLEAALEASGAIAVTYTASDDEEIFEPPVGTTPLWQTTRVTGLYPLDSDRDAILTVLRAALGDDYPIA